MADDQCTILHSASIFDSILFPLQRSARRGILLLLEQPVFSWYDVLFVRRHGNELVGRFPSKGLPRFQDDAQRQLLQRERNEPQMSGEHFACDLVFPAALRRADLRFALTYSGDVASYIILKREIRSRLAKLLPPIMHGVAAARDGLSSISSIYRPTPMLLTVVILCHATNVY